MLRNNTVVSLALTAAFFVGGLLPVSLLWAAPQTTSGDATINADGIAEGVVFGGDHVLTVPASTNVGATSGLSFNTNGVVRGTITFQGSSTLSGSIGKNNPADLVNAINVDGTNGTTVTVGGGGVVESLVIDFGGDGSFVVGAGGVIDNGNSLSGSTTINADTAGEGELEFAGNADVWASIGATRKLRLLTINAGSVAFNEGNPTNATTLNFAGDGTYNLTVADSDITAAITASTDGQGTLILGNGAHTITGEIGTSATAIKQVQVGTGTSAFTGNIYADDLNFNADGTVTIVDSKVVSGTITTDSDGTGTVTYAGSSTVGSTIGASGAALNALNINGGTFSTGLNIAADTITVSNNATVLKMTADTTVIAATDLTFEDSTSAGLDLGSHVMTLTGKVDLNDDNALSTTINSSTDFGQIAASGNSTLNADTTVDVTVRGHIANGTAFKIIDGAAGGTIANPTTVTDNSLTASFAGSGASGDLTLTATTAALPTVATNSDASGPGTALDSDADQGMMHSTYLSIAGMSSAAGLTDSLVSLNPQDSDAQIRTAFKIQQDINRVVTDRLTGSRSPLGVSTGEESIANSLWVKMMGGYADQNARKGVEGYAVTYGGITAGADSQVSDTHVLGLAFTYSKGAINYDDSANGNTLIDGYQATLYADFHEGDWYLNQLFQFGISHHDSSRTAVVGSETLRATYDYWGQQYATYTEIGRDIELNSVIVSPLASFGYTHLSLDGYREIGAGEISLEVNRQRYNSAETGLGVKVANATKINTMTSTSEIRGVWYWDMIGDRADMTSKFSGGSVSFKTRGLAPVQHRFVLGVLWNLAFIDNTDISFGYDVELKERYVGQNAVFKARYVF